MTTVVLVGRTNVGKSTLFNRIVGRRAAIVHDKPGVTRDRKESLALFQDLNFKIVDTAGLEATTALAEAMWQQTQRAIHEGDVIVMVVDARSEITALDKRLAADLRTLKKPVLLIANKCEGRAQNSQMAEFYQFGLGDPIAVSAEHNLGMDPLYQALKEHVRPAAADAAAADPAERPLKLAIVGRPNVGKSTLINKLLKQERLLVGPEAGVTRDAITVSWEWQGKPILLTDTAGLRKRGKVADDLEHLSGADTRHAIDFAEVVVLVLDANAPMERQDLTIASKTLDEGRALVIALNKWDAVRNQKAALNTLSEVLEKSLQQVKGLSVVPISAKTGFGLNQMMEEVFRIYRLWNKRVPTHKLNEFLRAVVEAHPTPMASNGRRVPMKYMTQVNARPPTFVIFTSNPDQLPESYMRYLTNSIRDTFGMRGVPMRIHLRKRENPFADRARRTGKK